MVKVAGSYQLRILESWRVLYFNEKQWTEISEWVWKKKLQYMHRGET